MPAATSNPQPDARLHIAMPFQGRWARKLFVRGLGLPRHQVYRVLRGIKTTLMPQQVRMRRKYAEAIAPGGPDFESWRRTGHRALGPEELGDLRPILAVCRALRSQAEEQLQSGPTGAKNFLRYVERDQDFLAHPEVLHFVLSEPILRAVSGYLGTVPVLANVSLLWSPAHGSSPRRSSQRFHNDHEDVTQIKLFVHIDDVDADHGVFTFHPAEPTRLVRRMLGTRHGRLEDADVARALDGRPPLTLVGPAGSAHFVDTSRCIHFGSRPSAKGRLVLQAQYLRCNSPAYSNLALTLDKKTAAKAWSPLQRMALGLREPGKREW